MDKKTIYTWIALLALTLISGIISTQTSNYIPIIIILLATFKFIGVAFDFMELRKANALWKILLISFLIIFNSVIFIILLN